MRNPKCGLFMAILDFIGGFIGLFMFSILTELFFREPIVQDFKYLSDSDKQAGNPVVQDFQNLSDDAKKAFTSRALVWKAAGAFIQSFLGQRITTYKEWFILLMILYTYAVLCAGHILFGIFLFVGIIKNKMALMKSWLIFKIVYLLLTTIMFVTMLFFTEVSGHGLTVIGFVALIFVNIVFLASGYNYLIKVSQPQPIVFTSKSDSLLDVQVDPADPNSTFNGIVAHCFKYIEENGTTTEGLYRIPGSKKDIDCFIKTAKANPYVETKDLLCVKSIPIVTSAVKELYRERRPPVIPTESLPEIERIAVFTDPSAGSRAWKEFISKLPQQNLVALKILFEHLSKISTYYVATQMNSTNLAIYWAPTIIPCLDTVKLQPIQNLVKGMIDHYKLLFEGLAQQQQVIVA